MSLSQLCANIITKDSSESRLMDKNVLEFVNAPWGLGLGCTKDVPPLYPVQRFILKCYYGLELSRGNERDIIINDQFNERELYRFNEQEYISFLYNEGRINREAFEGNFNTTNLLLVVGRRSGKTVVTSVIIAYETYRLLNKYSPQEYYGIMPEDDIKIVSVSTSKETASELFNKVTGHLQRSEFFRKFRNNPTQKSMSLRSQRDIDKYGDKGRCTIHINVAPCSASGLRGANNIVVALDEMAFFFADKSGKEVSSSNRDDRAIYNAVTPSVAKFKKPDGTPDGKIIGISSPFTKSGKFYEEYERSFGESNNDLLMVQAPTWEVDPGLSTQYLKNKYDENPISFRSEFGAQFSDRMAGWIEDDSMLRQNVVPGLTYKKRGKDRVPHFLGVDIGLKGDGTAISVGHWVTELVGGAPEDFIELDACDIRYSQEEGLEYFKPEDMADWIGSYTKRFFIIKGLLDQYYGMSIVPLLHKAGHKQFEFRSFTESLNSKVYQNLLSHLISGNLRMPEGPGVAVGDTVDKDSDLVKELLTLQSEQKSKYIVRVFAPDRKGCHDDLSDSFSRMVYLATEYKYKNFGKKITSPVTRKSGGSGRSTLSYERKKAGVNRSSRGIRSFARSSGPTFNRL
jgi:hypothetical protein